MPKGIGCFLVIALGSHAEARTAGERCSGLSSSCSRSSNSQLGACLLTRCSSPLAWAELAALGLGAWSLATIKQEAGFEPLADKYEIRHRT